MMMIEYVDCRLHLYSAGEVARVESLQGRMGESERQVEGLFESLLSESFGEK
jgi:hypothetical protein